MKSFDLDDDTFIRQFEDHSLPFDRWTHRSHIRMAYIYLTRFAFPEALERIRKGVQTYNRAHNVPEGPNRGYHETVTQAWARLVASALARHGPAADSRAFCEEMPHLGHRTLLRVFYTKERIMSPEAKAGFVEPDIIPLP